MKKRKSKTPKSDVIMPLYKRIKRFQETGILPRRGAITAFVLVTLDRHLMEESKEELKVADRISAFPEVEEVYTIAGHWDLVIKVVADSPRELGDFVVKKLRNIKGINKTITLITLHRIWGKSIIAGSEV